MENGSIMTPWPLTTGGAPKSCGGAITCWPGATGWTTSIGLQPLVSARPRLASAQQPGNRQGAASSGKRRRAEDKARNSISEQSENNRDQRPEGGAANLRESIGSAQDRTALVLARARQAGRGEDFSQSR
jgi:hypothetical protein